MHPAVRCFRLAGPATGVSPGPRVWDCRRLPHRRSNRRPRVSRCANPRFKDTGSLCAPPPNVFLLFFLLTCGVTNDISGSSSLSSPTNALETSAGSVGPIVGSIAKKTEVPQKSNPIHRLNLAVASRFFVDILAKFQVQPHTDTKNTRPQGRR
jgi:hypothetical protein